MTSVENLVGRHVAVWSEPDPSPRRQAIAALWTEDGAHCTPPLEARGYEAIEARITGARDRPVNGSDGVGSGPTILTVVPAKPRIPIRASRGAG